MTSRATTTGALLAAVAAALAAATTRDGWAALCAILLVAYALGAKRHRLRSHGLALSGRAIGLLADRLDQAQAAALLEQGRLHEVRATAAGIAAATQMVRTLPPADRGAMDEAIQAEASRLLRLLGEHPYPRATNNLFGTDGTCGSEVVPVEVDEIIGRLVLAHSARGHTVAWEPSGLSATCPPDDLAEALNALLDNAARHGTPDDIHIAATAIKTEAATDGRVEIAVIDSGPGVPPGIGDQIFDWGRRRPDSPGNGVGLTRARERIRAVGGDLHLQDNQSAGACFVLTIPAAAKQPAPQQHLALVG